MGRPCKVMPGSPCDELRAHLPHSANKDPLLWKGGARCTTSRYQGKLIISLLRGKKFSDAKAPPSLGSCQCTSLTRKALKNLYSLLNLISFSSALNRTLRLQGSFPGPELNPGLCPALFNSSSPVLRDTPRSRAEMAAEGEAGECEGWLSSACKSPDPFTGSRFRDAPLWMNSSQPLPSRHLSVSLGSRSSTTEGPEVGRDTK